MECTLNIQLNSSIVIRTNERSTEPTKSQRGGDEHHDVPSASAKRPGSSETRPASAPVKGSRPR